MQATLHAPSTQLVVIKSDLPTSPDRRLGIPSPYSDLPSGVKLNTTQRQQSFQSRYSQSPGGRSLLLNNKAAAQAATLGLKHMRLQAKVAYNQMQQT
jgi:hypothetical protein